MDLVAKDASSSTTSVMLNDSATYRDSVARVKLVAALCTELLLLGIDTELLRPVLLCIAYLMLGLTYSCGVLLLMRYLAAAESSTLASEGAGKKSLSVKPSYC